MTYFKIPTNVHKVINDKDIKLKLEKNNYWIGYLNQCKHYNKINDTKKTRISMDFRIIPYSKYKESNNLSATSKSKFIIGDYYIII